MSLCPYTVAAPQHGVWESYFGSGVYGHEGGLSSYFSEIFEMSCLMLITVDPTGRFRSHLSAGDRFQASPRMRRLADPPHRNGFVILRTAGSSPVAPHPAS